MNRNRKISVIGMGYVGLPVAVAFGRLGEVIGYDIDERRIAELGDRGSDSTGEVAPDELAAAQITFTTDSRPTRAGRLSHRGRADPDQRREKPGHGTVDCRFRDPGTRARQG